MKIRTLILSLFLIHGFAATAQVHDTLSLERCRRLALGNYPLIKQNDLLNESLALKLRNLSTNYYPQLSLNGQATLQSAVTSIPQFSPMFEVPEMSKDQYKLTLDLSQVIWDGGLTAAQTRLERSSLKADQMNVVVETAKIKERVHLIYFNLLLAQQNEKLILNLQEALNSRLAITEAGIRNGTILQSNADIIKAELIRTRQQLTELLFAKKAALQMLSEFINLPLSETTELIIPEALLSAAAYDNQRPEMQLLDLQMNRLDVSKKVITAKVLPRFYVFGQAGYGRPGYNMLSDDFDFFGIMGVKANWNLSGFYQSGREKRLIDLQKNILSIQKETFDKNLRISTQKETADMEKYRQLMLQDEELIKLRENITKTAASQLDNGVITATEYITELNYETQARLNLELHRMQLQQAAINYLNALGKL